jgi:hypothetical protein
VEAFTGRFYPPTTSIRIYNTGYPYNFDFFVVNTDGFTTGVRATEY